jgi:hypothetical protein
LNADPCGSGSETLPVGLEKVKKKKNKTQKAGFRVTKHARKLKLLEIM